MARQLHTLTEEETQLVQEFVEGGIAETSEDALQLLIDAGEISDAESNGGGSSYIPEGFMELKFNSGHQKASFTVANRQAKKEKNTDFNFESGMYYYGTRLVKDKDTGTINFAESSLGDNVGENPEIVITGIQYGGSRFVPSAKDNVSTTFAPNMFEQSQKAMIDFNSKKSFFQIRQELFKEFEVDPKKYETRKNIPDNKKVSFEAHIFGLVNVEGEWKPFMMTEKVKSNDRDFLYDFNEDVKGKQKSKLVAKIEVEEDAEGNLIKKAIFDRDIELAEYKETFSNLVMSNMKAVSKFLAEQKESVKTSSKEEPEETEDENIEWE